MSLISTHPMDAALVADVQRRRDELVQLAASLVRVPTVVGAEERAQELVDAWLAENGFAVERVQVDGDRALADPYAGYPSRSYEGRSSVVGRLAGSGAGRSLHLSGHVDVVPIDSAEEWTRPPWDGQLADGRLWGRGAADMKGGLASYLIAAAAVASVCAGELRGDLIFSSVIEEECGGNGMWSVLDAGFDADATLIGEPTGLKLGWAATGVVWARLRARGAAGHSMSTGRLGPFDELCRAVGALRELEAEINRNPSDEVFASASDWPYGLTVGRIEGGVWTSSAPAELSAWVRFGFGRELEPAEMQERIASAVTAASADVEVTFEAFRARAWVGDRSGPLPDLVAAMHHGVAGAEAESVVFTATTDARSVPGPCLCYGPIGGGFHAKDEWVDIGSLVHTASVVARTAAAWLA